MKAPGPVARRNAIASRLVQCLNNLTGIAVEMERLSERRRQLQAKQDELERKLTEAVADLPESSQ